MSANDTYSAGINKKDERPRGTKTLQSITIKPADNGGYIVDCSHRMKVKGGDSYSGYCEPETSAFESKDEALKFVTDKL